ncbi:Uncharacterised protein [Vibrio cholerae]|nr:Uncharacterised protein [Vibrio cholerae]
MQRRSEFLLVEPFTQLKGGFSLLSHGNVQ